MCACCNATDLSCGDAWCICYNSVCFLFLLTLVLSIRRRNYYNRLRAYILYRIAIDAIELSLRSLLDIKCIESMNRGSGRRMFPPSTCFYNPRTIKTAHWHTSTLDFSSHWHRHIGSRDEKEGTGKRVLRTRFAQGK